MADAKREAREYLKLLRMEHCQDPSHADVVRQCRKRAGCTLRTLGTSAVELAALKKRACLNNARFWLDAGRNPNSKETGWYHYLTQSLRKARATPEEIESSAEELATLLGASELNGVRSLLDHAFEYHPIGRSTPRETWIGYARSRVAELGIEWADVGTSEEELANPERTSILRKARAHLLFFRTEAPSNSAFVLSIRRMLTEGKLSHEEIGTTEVELAALEREANRLGLQEVVRSSLASASAGPEMILELKEDLAAEGFTFADVGFTQADLQKVKSRYHLARARKLYSEFVLGRMRRGKDPMKQIEQLARWAKVNVRYVTKHPLSYA